MVNENILEPIVSKISKVSERKYTTSRGKPLIFDNLSQLQIVYVALKEFAPQLRGRDTNEDRNHNKRIDYEKQRIEYNAEFLAIDREHKELLIESMIKTRFQSLDEYIRVLKEFCIHLGYRKKQIENLVPFLRDAMVLIADRKVNLQQELFELKKIIYKDTRSADYLDKNGVICFTNLSNQGWI